LALAVDHGGTGVATRRVAVGQEADRYVAESLVEPAALLAVPGSLEHGLRIRERLLAGLLLEQARDRRVRRTHGAVARHVARDFGDRDAQRAVGVGIERLAAERLLGRDPAAADVEHLARALLLPQDWRRTA